MSLYSGLECTKNKKRTKNLIFEYQKHAEKDDLPKPGLFIPNSATNDAASRSTSNPEVVEAETTPNSEIESQTMMTSNAVSDKTSALLQNIVLVKDETSAEASEANPKHEMGKNDVSKNTDLFKAIFLSSSESEAEDEKEDERNEKKDAILKNVLSDQLVPRIKPKKEGILSNIDFKSFSTNKSYEETQKESDISNESALGNNSQTLPDKNIFGPQLPANRITVPHVTKPVQMKDADDDMWVEKDDNQKGKKHKSHKHKKKHKHKHTR